MLTVINSVLIKVSKYLLYFSFKEELPCAKFE